METVSTTVRYPLYRGFFYFILFYLFKILRAIHGLCRVLELTFNFYFSDGDFIKVTRYF